MEIAMGPQFSNISDPGEGAYFVYTVFDDGSPQVFIIIHFV